MKEYFEPRRITGKISITLSNKKKWTADKGTLCEQIVATVNLYAAQGYRLTLRQLYYQLVSADYIPNDDVVYKKLSGILDDLRYSGKVDWDAIEDRGRVPYLPYYAAGPAAAINDLIRQYRLDRMEDQNTFIEVWTEKDAISGILREITSEYHVRLVVNKGYSSSSAMHDAYLRFAAQIAAGKPVVVLYFGDHDPSGLDMVRDIQERILFFLAYGDQLDSNDFYDKFIEPWWLENYYTDDDMFHEGYISDAVMQRYSNDEDGTYEDEYRKHHTAGQIKMYLAEKGLFKVLPIGLTREQIDQYNPPPNPAKITDPRAAWYIKEHGPTSWEVDALRPNVMTELVRSKILEIIDADKFNAKTELEWEHVKRMKAFAKTFN